MNEAYRASISKQSSGQKRKSGLNLNMFFYRNSANNSNNSIHSKVGRGQIHQTQKENNNNNDSDNNNNNNNNNHKKENESIKKSLKSMRQALSQKHTQNVPSNSNFYSNKDASHGTTTATTTTTTQRKHKATYDSTMSEMMHSHMELAYSDHIVRQTSDPSQIHGLNLKNTEIDNQNDNENDNENETVDEHIDELHMAGNVRM